MLYFNLSRVHQMKINAKKKLRDFYFNISIFLMFSRELLSWVKLVRLETNKLINKKTIRKKTTNNTRFNLLIK